MRIEEALLKLVEYQDRELRAKQTAIDYLNKENDELRNELFELKIDAITE